MNITTKIQVADIIPSLEAVLRLQGIPPDAEIQPRVIEAGKTALQLFSTLAAPVGMITEIKPAEFGPIYHGIGLNSTPGPIEEVYPRAGHLALFAATVGPKLGEKISKLFVEGEFALGSLLDSAASNGTDLISHVLEDRYGNDLIRLGRASKGTVVMAYSPGYCGWHVSAQKALFKLLQPEKIGITLRDSFLMEPLKSISGVLIAGPEDIHKYESSYPFCAECKSQPCRDRTSSLDTRQAN